MTEPLAGEMLRCEWCGQEFERPHRFGPRPKTCSPEHRKLLAAARRAAAEVGSQQLASAIAASPEFTALIENVRAAAAAGLRDLQLSAAGAGGNRSKRLAELAGASGFAETLKRLNLPARGAAAVGIGSMMDTLRKTVPTAIPGDVMKRFAEQHQRAMRELVRSMTPAFRFNDYVTWMTTLPRGNTLRWADALQRREDAFVEVLRAAAPAVDEALEPLYEEWAAAAQGADVDTDSDVMAVAPALFVLAMMGQLLLVLDDHTELAAAWLWAWLGAIDDLVGRGEIMRWVWRTAHRQVEAADDDGERPR